MATKTIYQLTGRAPLPTDELEVQGASNGASAKVTLSDITGRIAVSVKDYGAVGDGVTDDTASIQAAITAVDAGTLFFPKGTYKVTSTLTQPTSQAWAGDGGQRATTLKKYFNGDLVVMGSLTRLSDLNLDCNGASYTGRGIAVTSGYSQIIERVRVIDSAGIALEFANNIGGGACVSQFEATTTATTTVAAIKIADTAASPKFFSGIWLPGGLFDFAAGGNGVSLDSFYINNFVTDADSLLMHISNGRTASGSTHTIISGSGITLANVAFSGQVDFVNCQGVKATNCSFDNGFTEDSSNCQYNEIADQTKVFAMTWTQPSGTQPSLGNGTLNAWQSRNGYICTLYFKLTMGSTTTTGNNASAYLFSLPYKTHPFTNFNQRDQLVVATIGGTSYNCFVSMGNDESVFTLQYAGGSVRSDTPAVFASGSTISGHFTYMVR